MSWSEFWKEWKPEANPGSLLLLKKDMIFGHSDQSEKEQSKDLSSDVIEAGTLLLLLSIERTEKYSDSRRAEFKVTALYEEQIRFYFIEVVVNRYNGFARNFEVMPAEA